MNPIVVPCRDAVVTAINGAGLTPSLTAVGIYDMTISLQGLVGGRVVVIPATKEADLLSRGHSSLGNVSIDIAIQYKVGTAGPTKTELDPYMNLNERYADLFLGKAFTITLADATTRTASCLRVEYPHLVYDEHMRDFRVFTSVLRPHFTVT